MEQYMKAVEIAKLVCNGYG